MNVVLFGLGTRCVGTGHRSSACRVQPPILASWRSKTQMRNGHDPRGFNMSASWKLILIIAAIPVLGLVIALIASRLPNRRPDE